MRILAAILFCCVAFSVHADESCPTEETMVSQIVEAGAPHTVIEGEEAKRAVAFMVGTGLPVPDPVPDKLIVALGAGKIIVVMVTAGRSCQTATAPLGLGIKLLEAAKHKPSERDA